MRALITVALAAALILFPSAALAGSDSPTPYAVTAEGITLPDGQVFEAHGHVNWRTSWAQHGVHFDPNNGHHGGKYIGQSFLPFNLEPGECVVWLQWSGADEHFGEGGQEPICRELAPEPTPEPAEPTPEPTDEPTDEPTEPPVTEPTPPITCTPPYAPGWLDESGQPTGCVWNGPDTTEEPSSPTPTPAPSPSLNLPVDPSPAPAPVDVDDAPADLAPSPTSSPSPTSTLPRTSLAETGTGVVAYISLAGAMIAAGTLTNMLLRRKP